MTDDEIRAGIRLLAETTGIFTETAGGVTTAALAKLAERGDIDPDERVVLVITGEGLKTLDAVRGTFEALRDRAVATTQFEAAVEGAAVARLMAVTVKLPTQLRDGRRRARPRSSVEGATVGEVLDALFDRHGELRDRLVRRRRRAAPLRQRLRRRRGHPLRRRRSRRRSPTAHEVQILPAVAGG